MDAVINTSSSKGGMGTPGNMCRGCISTLRWSPWEPRAIHYHGGRALRKELRREFESPRAPGRGGAASSWARSAPLLALEEQRWEEVTLGSLREPGRDAERRALAWGTALAPPPPRSRWELAFSKSWRGQHSLGATCYRDPRVPFNPPRVREEQAGVSGAAPTFPDAGELRRGSDAVCPAL